MSVPTNRLQRYRFAKEMLRQRYLYLLLLPGTLYLIVNNYLPMFGVLIAFKKVNFRDGIFGSPWVGFNNFKFLFSSTDAFLITRNTVLYNLVFIVLGLIFAVSFAVLLNEIRNRFFAKLFQSALFLPYFLSFVVVSYLGYSLLSMDYGFINKRILEPLGFEPILWYNDPKYWPFILPLVNIWKEVGYGTVIYLASIVGIDSTYYEAALIDGANKRRQFFHITLPSLTPIIIIVMILSVGRIFNADFGLFYSVPLNSGMLYSTTIVIDTYVYRALSALNDPGMAAAAGLYQAVVGFVLVLGSNWIVRRINKDHAMF